MNKSVERVLRTTAVTAAFVASAGKTAIAESQAHAHPTIVELAKQINRQKTTTTITKPDCSVTFKTSLPGKRLATIILESSTQTGHKPNPATANFIYMAETLQKSKKNQAPELSIELLKQADGTWNAYSESSSRGEPHMSYHLEEIGGTVLQNYDQVVASDEVQNFQSTTDSAGAVRLFHSLEDGAESFLQNALHHRPVGQ